MYADPKLSDMRQYAQWIRDSSAITDDSSRPPPLVLFPCKES